MEVSERGYSPKNYAGVKSFSLGCRDVQDKDDWRLRINGETG